MPIFYDVAPSEVKYQTGGYGEAIALYISKKRYDDEIIWMWKAALREAGTIRGWDLISQPNRYTSLCLKLIYS